MIKIIILSILFSIQLFAQKTECDFIYHNGVIATVDEKMSQASAIAVKDGRILAVGNETDILKKYHGKQIDLEKKFMYPGLIDPHSHFYGLGDALEQANLFGTKSFEEVIQKVKNFKTDQEWILGRGWDQNDWPEKNFPDNKKLNELFPNRPVLLMRIDGHAAIANDEALRRARLYSGVKIPGGELISKDGRLTGILVDNAVDSLRAKIPAPKVSEIQRRLLLAEKSCFEVGLTSVSDAGLDKNIVDQMRSLSDSVMKMRIYIMLNPSEENISQYLNKGPLKTDYLNIRSFKFYADGALGSRGACLLKPYSDKPEKTGFLLNTPEYFLKHAEIMKAKGFQMNTHCIGDSAARLILDMYGKILAGKNDFRWRIEHAQVIHPDDINKFGKFSVIPSVQPVHATSDMYWAEERLGKERVKTAYIYKKLLNQNGKIPCGSDFPVEWINPVDGFYAAVFRKDKKGFPVNGFQKEDALSREEALKGMTIWAAWSQFEEKEKGSIEVGKLADFTVLDTDLLKDSEEKIKNAKCLMTISGGKVVFSAKDKK